jgi:hypothetical protein
MPENNYFLVQHFSPTLHVLYATLLNRTPGNTYYYHVHNNTYMPYASNAIIKRSGNFANLFSPAQIQGVILLWMPEYTMICLLIIRSLPGYYLVLATHHDAIVMHVSNLTYYVSLAYHINTNLLLLPPPQSLYNSLNSHSAMIAFLLRLLIEKTTNKNPYYKISKHMAGMLPLSWSSLQVQEPHPTSQPWHFFMINYTFQDRTLNKHAQTSTS